MASARDRSRPASIARVGWSARSRSLGARLCLSVAVCATAIVASLAVARLNSVWFDRVNGVLDLTGTVERGLLYSSWLLLVGGLVVFREPAAFGFQMGTVLRDGRLVGGALLAGAISTVAILRVVGPIPYSDASLFIEAVDVPVTEELVFRGVMLTALLATMTRIWDVRAALVLAVVIDGVAFGVAHLSNAATWNAVFVVGQSTFAAVLGTACAVLMVRTRSIYPAIALHGVVNAVVVIAP